MQEREFLNYYLCSAIFNKKNVINRVKCFTKITVNMVCLKMFFKSLYHK